MPIIGDLYKQIGRSTAGAVCIAAAYDAETDAVVGLTASSFVTLSFDPPMIMFALQHRADSYASIVSSKAFGISVEPTMNPIVVEMGHSRFGCVSQKSRLNAMSGHHS